MDPIFVFPGYKINPSLADTNDPPQIINSGPGLIQNADHLLVTKPGLLHHKPNTHQYWVDSDQKRYIANTGESVIGIIAQRSQDYFKVDIGTAHYAILPVLSFEGASKRNKPTVAVGDLVYARVAKASIDMEPQLECVNMKTGKAGSLGPLFGGYMVKVSLKTCRRFRQVNFPKLDILAQYFTFELAVGHNGRIHVSVPKDPSLTLRIAHAIEQSQYMDTDQFQSFVDELSTSLRNAQS